MGRQRATTDPEVQVTPATTEAPAQAEPQATEDQTVWEQPQGANEDGSYIYHDPTPGPEQQDAGPQVPPGMPEGTHYEDREDGLVLVVPDAATGASDEPAADSAQAAEEAPAG